jgi:hypothetical protein
MSFASLAGSYLSGATSVAGISNAGTLAWPVLSTGGLVSANVHTSTAAINALSNAGTGAAAVALSMATASVGALTAAGVATGTSTVATTGIPTFGYNGSLAQTASGLTYAGNQFTGGIMSTGASLASVALSSTAVTLTGSVALLQPWFALAGS